MPWQGIVFLALLIGLPVVIAWWLGGSPDKSK